MGRLERQEGAGPGRRQAEVHRSGQPAEGQARRAEVEPGDIQLFTILLFTMK